MRGRRKGERRGRERVKRGREEGKRGMEGGTHTLTNVVVNYLSILIIGFEV